jgi:hypothetical protein
MMPLNKRIGYKLSSEDSAASDSAQSAQAPPNSNSRRPTTDIRIQSLLHRDAQQQLNALDRTPTVPELRQSLDEHTSPIFSALRHHEPEPTPDDQLDVTAMLARIAAVDGFLGGAVLDAEWGELLATHQTSLDGDIAQAALLSLTTLPSRAYSQHLGEIATTSAHHYELTTILDTPFLSLIIFTVWDRARTNLALAQMEISAAVATSGNKRAIHAP